ncbi:T9SS type A sorting domain-containing protein [Mariniflexile sp.]|uniref:T9SS type A sorting domain-containing protein n=1 Tax=Mariniflexile sp. TaxID=1979402 RepID=UPI0040474B8E
MKQILLFSAFILFFLSPVLSFSQPVYKVDEQRVYSWDNSILDWKHDTTAQFTYDNGGNKETNLLILQVPSLEKQFQNNKTYNANNNITLDAQQFWNNALMEWQNTSQVMYDYGGANNLISETTQTYVSMNWQNTSKIEYEYNGSNNLIRKTTLYYNPGTMTFEKTPSSIQELYEYSGADITKQTIQSSLSGTAWFTEEIFETFYTSPGIQSGYLESTWNGSMYDLERATFTYTAGLITKVMYEIPDGSGGWDYNGQTIIDYVGTLVITITQKDDNDENEDRETNSYDANGNVTANILEDWVSGAWKPYYKIEKDYSVADPFSLSSEAFSKQDFKVYPNPASSVINISSQTPIKKVEMFDVLGKKVLSSSEEKQINTENLKSGVYVLKAFSNSQSATKRVIIK